jgi:hypothetical protein
MTVTLHIADDLLAQARHLAGNQNRSLSALVEDILRRELVIPASVVPKPATWMDAFSGDDDDEFLDRDLPLPDRTAMRARDVNFED